MVIKLCILFIFILTARTDLLSSQINKFDTMLYLKSIDRNDRIIYGDANGRVHVLEDRNGQFEEIWLSDYLEGAICGLFLNDINDDGLDELVVFTERGRIHYIDDKDYRVIWSNPPGEYAHFNGHMIKNVDEDPQPEIIICADGCLVIYDGRDQYEQWRSEQDNLAAKDILIEDVDGDGNSEIVLSDGYVFDARFFDLEWQSSEQFGDRIDSIDIDGDGIKEIIGEFQGRYIRVFDIDLRREKSIAQ